MCDNCRNSKQGASGQNVLQMRMFYQKELFTGHKTMKCIACHTNNDENLIAPLYCIKCQRQRCDSCMDYKREEEFGVLDWFKKTTSASLKLCLHCRSEREIKKCKRCKIN